MVCLVNTRVFHSTPQTLFPGSSYCTAAVDVKTRYSWNISDMHVIKMSLASISGLTGGDSEEKHGGTVVRLLQ